MKFSIITPTYNRAHTIERAINSILKQSYQNFEMIIIDDGSTDNTFEIVKKYLEDPRIRYIGPNKNGGVNVARNIGLKNISKDSDWITFLDSDDEFLSDALEKMKKTIEMNSAYNYFRFAVLYDNGEAACFAKYDNIVLDYEGTLRQEDASGEWVVTLSKKILDNGFKFEESVNAFESIAWYALSKKEKCLHSLKKVRIYQLDTEGLQRQAIKTDEYYKNNIKGISLYLKLHGNDLQRYNKKDYATKLYVLGNANFKLGNYKAGIENIYKAIKIDPFNVTIVRRLLKLKKA